MENYVLTPSPKTPRLYFNAQSGEFEISGRSIPENSIEFYKPLMNWLDEYINSAAAKTRLSVNLEYFNTSSSKCLIEIFRKLEKLEGKDVKVLWHYEEEDEDMLESGDDFKKIIKVPIELVVVKN